MGKGAAPSRDHTEPVEVANCDLKHSAPAADAPAQTTERETVLVFGDGRDARRWRVRGLPKNLAVGVAKVNMMVSVEGGRLHVDTLDLYAARAQAVFVQ